MAETVLLSPSPPSPPSPQQKILPPMNLFNTENENEHESKNTNDTKKKKSNKRSSDSDVESSTTQKTLKRGRKPKTALLPISSDDGDDDDDDDDDDKNDNSTQPKSLQSSSLSSLQSSSSSTTVTEVNSSGLIPLSDLGSKHKFTISQVYKISNDNDFFVLFHNSTPFKTLVELIHQVLENIHFRVVDRIQKNGQRFRGITVNSMDPKNVSMIVARLKADEVYPDHLSEQNFCVSSDAFSSLVKIIKPGCCLELKRPKNDANIKIKGYNANRKNYESSSSIPTLDIDDKPFPLDTIDYKFVVDINLQILKSITKVAQNTNINALNINFKIYEGVDEKNETKTTKVCISLDADDNHPTTSHTFRSVTKWDRQNSIQTVIKTNESTEDEEDMNNDETLSLVLDENFSTKYLNLFLKSMERQIITLKMSPKKPLVIIYPLAADDDVGYCTFIVAPGIKEGDL
jgi:hypothetical protein